MKDTIYTRVVRPDKDIITKAVEQMVKKVQEYVPGYRLLVPPIVEGDKVTTIIEVEGAGHYLPKYSGNLDIMTSAAKSVGELMAKRLLQRRGALVS
jgi:acetaldehyde dehydrogenase